MLGLRPVALLALALCGVCVGAPASADGSRTRKDAAVEPTHWGSVVGRVYDAGTGEPLADTKVSVQHEGQFDVEKRAVCQTSATGSYACQAILGRVSSNVDVGRLLSTSLVGLIAGGAKKETKRVDVSQVNLRLVREGYRTFEGPVPTRSIDAMAFSVTLEPVLLTRADSQEVSTVAAEGWGPARVTGVTLDPAIVPPRANVTITARVRCPAVPKKTKMTMVAWSSVLKKLKLSRQPDRESPGEMVFSGRFRVGKRPQDGRVLVGAMLSGCPYDVAAGGGSAFALLQVAEGEEQTHAARLCLEAYEMWRTERFPEAAEKLKEVCALPQATGSDFSDLAEVSEKIHDYQTASTSLARALEMTPEKERMAVRGRYARALVDAGEIDKVLQEMAPIAFQVKEKDRPKKVALDMMVAVGAAYLRKGDISNAESVREQLKQWPGSGYHPGAQELRRSLHLARLETAARAEPPGAPALADYGRALCDQGRWEEAVAQFRRALALDANLPALRWDLGYALLHVSGASPTASADLDQALADTANQAYLPADAKGNRAKSKDFKVWHRYAMLLYRKACQQEDASDAPAASNSLQSTREALAEAIRCGRAGASESQGLYSWQFGYASPAVRAVAGFAYPEASSDFLLRESLGAIEKRADDYLAHFSVATGLIDLGQSDLAGRSLARCRALRPDLHEAAFADAVIARQVGNPGRAQQAMVDVLKVNPRHPRAHLVLAEMYTEDGRIEDAAACLAAHAKYYGARR